MEGSIFTCPMLKSVRGRWSYQASFAQRAIALRSLHACRIWRLDFNKLTYYKQKDFHSGPFITKKTISDLILKGYLDRNLKMQAPVVVMSKKHSFQHNKIRAKSL